MGSVSGESVPIHRLDTDSAHPNANFVDYPESLRTQVRAYFSRYGVTNLGELIEVIRASETTPDAAQFESVVGAARTLARMPAELGWDRIRREPLITLEGYVSDMWPMSGGRVLVEEIRIGATDRPFVHVVDIASRQIVQTLPERDGMVLGVTADDRVVVSRVNELWFWDPAHSTRRDFYRPIRNSEDFAVHGGVLYSQSQTGGDTLIVKEDTDGELARVMVDEPDIRLRSVTRQGHYVVQVSEDSLKVVDHKTGKELSEFSTIASRMRCAGTMSDDHVLIFTNTMSVLWDWRPDSDAVAPLMAETLLRAFAVHPMHNRYVAALSAAGGEERLKIYDRAGESVVTNKVVCLYRDAPKLENLTVTPEGRILMSADKEIVVFGARKGTS